MTQKVIQSPKQQNTTVILEFRRLSQEGGSELKASLGSVP